MLRENQSEQMISPQSILTSSLTILKIKYLIEISKKQSNLSLIQYNETSAKFQYIPNSQSQLSNKIYVNLIIKNNLLQIKCFLLSNRTEIRYIEKSLAALNQKLTTTVYINDKIIVVEGFLGIEIRQKIILHEFCTGYKFVIHQIFEVLKEIQHIIFQKKKENYYNIVEITKKTKEIFEDNRIKREKSTKIYLLEKNSDVTLSRIVNHYKQAIENNNPIIRPLYQKFKQRRQKISQQSDEAMRKLKQRIKKYKQCDEAQDSQTGSMRGNGKEYVRSKKFILKPICIFQQNLMEVLEPGGFGEVFKYKCTFEQLDTVASDSQLYIDQQRNRIGLNLERKQIVDILVKKKPKQVCYGKQSFNTQYNCLKYLKNEECPQIAQYFEIVEKRQMEGDRMKYIYSKYYEYKLNDFQKETAKGRIKMMMDLAKGIEFMVENKLLHRDIKPGNICLTNKKKVKLIDFGSACLCYGNEHLNQILGQSSKKFCFSRLYTLVFHQARVPNMSIEQFNRHSLYDLYAYGKITFEFFGQAFGDCEFIIDHMKYIFQKCMQANPQDRLTPQQISIYLQIVLKALSFYIQI